MRKFITVSSVFLAVLLLILASGCALDPMERLSEKVEAQEADVRRKAILDLANLRDDRAVETLVEVLKDDEAVYDEAGVALVKQGRQNVDRDKEDPIIEMIADVANDDHAPTPNRARAAWVLGEIGDREAIPALRTAKLAVLATGAPAGPVRAQAKTALKKLGDSSIGVAYEIPMGTFAKAEVDLLPEVEPVVAAEEETAKQDEQQEDAESESSKEQAA